MSKRRRLSPEDQELWGRVTKAATPLHPKPSLLKKAEARPTSPSKKTEPNVPAPIPRFKLGERAIGKAPPHSLAPDIHAEVSTAPLRMDRKNYGKMTKGKLVPEGRIDLHGMTLSAAHPALIGFILRAHADGKRLVLVITGKGRDRDDMGPIPQRRGVLRHQVPAWLSQAPLGGIVLQVAPAHRSHGGGGAYYVYLRRR